MGVLVCILQGRELQLPEAGWPGQPPRVMPPPSVQALAGWGCLVSLERIHPVLRLGSQQFLETLFAVLLVDFRVCAAFGRIYICSVLLLHCVVPLAAFPPHPQFCFYTLPTFVSDQRSW